MATSIPEGTVFTIPVREHRYASGLVARRQPRGHVVALYVFASQVLTEGDGIAPLLPHPSNASFRGRFSDHLLRTGEWPSHGVHPQFSRVDWPFDRVGHRDSITGACRVIHLDDRNPLKMVGNRIVPCTDVGDLPSDAIESPILFVREILPTLLPSD
jgi:hypothetical protein